MQERRCRKTMELWRLPKVIFQIRLQYNNAFWNIIIFFFCNLKLWVIIPNSGINELKLISIVKLNPTRKATKWKLKICSNNCHGYVYFTTKNMYPLLFYRRVKSFMLFQLDSAEKDRREAERDRNELEELDAAIGFSKVIKKISASKKLVVGHNMLLDLCFTLNQVNCVAKCPRQTYL